MVRVRVRGARGMVRVGVRVRVSLLNFGNGGAK